jgi:23S rRNA (cytidine2498-2'-O)-methyltransferase
VTVPGSPFALAVCQPGTERLLKAEVARLRPDLHAGFQRPGLVTFKATGAPFGADETLPTVFGRAWACSAGGVREPDAIVAEAARVGATRLLLGPRDQGVPGEVPPARQAAADADAAALDAVLRAAGTFREGPPSRGDVCLDVITSPGEPPVVAWHVHGPGRFPAPVGRYALTPPADAPSRAWAKLEEGIRWAGLAPKPGETVIELGAAPGGGTRALVDRGLNVVAVDPRPLDPTLAKHPGVRWIRRAVEDVRRDELPAAPDWVVCDVHAAPPAALKLVRSILGPHPKGVRGLLWTLELKDDATAEAMPRWLLAVRGLGCRTVRAVQLPSNRRDVFVAATW